MINFTEKATPGVYKGIISPTKYRDDVLENAIANKFNAVINLGAGYETIRNCSYQHLSAIFSVS